MSIDYPIYSTNTTPIAKEGPKMDLFSNGPNPKLELEYGDHGRLFILKKDFDHFQNIADLNDEQVINKIRSDGIHILIDLV